MYIDRAMNMVSSPNRIINLTKGLPKARKKSSIFVAICFLSSIVYFIVYPMPALQINQPYCLIL